MENKAFSYIVVCIVLGAIAVVVFNVVVLTKQGEGNAATPSNNRRIAVFEPRDYTDKFFPLIEDIEINTDLTDGRWIIVLYSHSCMSCMKELPKYFDLSEKLKTTGSDIRIALIEMPPYATTPRHATPSDSKCLQGKLSNSKTWFISTPVAIIINDGIVVHYAEGVSAQIDR